MESTSKGESVLDVLARMKGELSFDVEEFIDADGSAAGGTATAAKPFVAGPSEGLPQKKMSAAMVESSSGTAEKTRATSPTDSQVTENVEEVSDYLGGLLNRYDANPAPPVEVAEPVGPSAALPRKKVRPAAPPLELPDSSTEVVAAESGEERGGENLIAAAAASPLTESTAVDGNGLGVLDQQDFVPRKRAPEEKACIDAMRELAVHSARKAIQVCDNKRRGFDAKHRLGLAAAAFVISGAALLMADHIFSFLGTVALFGIVAGCLFVVNWQKTITLVKKTA